MHLNQFLQQLTKQSSINQMKPSSLHYAKVNHHEPILKWEVVLLINILFTFEFI
ncbi:hypothetical protein TTHERM_001021932 (macronuclear) [Tetrahymena thermophila SB210]|uniref:Uncharacterized protein n=1 Tax=Tetrahymena thermophila (strain SB210) TaxID=312017 RepID=W7XEC8_TETTS|nr:hypothetical protein TTHERM_001021932 [Tetrahymena thermophila SB210]EWS76027.1 hypothetical protein TTHERM_001021932 [Tetrahymena thermophila SB210]|eukprot:XP_012651432.1 hypothetical protein TTHERM_001021932 [Tetrahymena thermophila SB210]